MKSKKKAFSLVELLVVTAIIIVLASIALVSVTLSHKKAKDVTRKNDLNQIGKAIDAYYAEYGSYFPLLSGDGGQGFGYINYTGYAGISIAEQLENHGYFKETPIDPSASEDLSQNVDPYPQYYLAKCAGGREFVLYAKLENPTAEDLDSYDYAVNVRLCTDVSGANYNYAYGHSD